MRLHWGSHTCICAIFSEDLGQPYETEKVDVADRIAAGDGMCGEAQPFA